MINVFEPSLGKEELLAVADSFNQHWVGRGAKTLQFEREWAKHIGADLDQVISVNCATEGLFQILELIEPRVAKVYQRDVILPSIHFIGAAQAILAAGGKPAFCDVDRHTLNPTLEHIQAKYQPKLTKAVCLLHYGGVAQELDAIREWCDQKGLYLIEDAACSPATVYKGKAAGTWGHFGVFSFDAMKIMSTGDGGMIYCENPEHVKQLRKRLYLGMEQESGLSSQSERWWEFGVSGMGRRAIMNDLAAGIGLEQLKKLPEFKERRVDICIKYNIELFDKVTMDTMSIKHESGAGGSSYYFYWIQTPRRDELAKFLRSQQIYCTFRYYPLHRVFKTDDDLPNTDYAADNTLLLPLHCNLSDGDVEMVCEKVREFYGKSI